MYKLPLCVCLCACVCVYLLVCVCVCVCVLSSHLFWTSDLWTHQPGSHRISPPSFCGACLNFYCDKDSAAPFPRRPWYRILCTQELIVLKIRPHLDLLSLVGHRKVCCTDFKYVGTAVITVFCPPFYLGLQNQFGRKGVALRTQQSCY